MNTSEFLMIAASVVPDRVALACEGESRTFAELQERVNRLANALQALGIGKGDKVAGMAPHSISYDARRGGMPPYEELLAAQEPDELFVDVDDPDPTIVIYTSGTTAMPKGVVLTYLSMSIYVTNTMEPATPETHDVTLPPLPLYPVPRA